MAKSTKYIIGTLILVILSSYMYVQLGNEVKVKLENSKTSVYVYGNKTWDLGGTEYNLLYNGSKQITKTKVSTNYSIKGKETILTRTSKYSNGAIITDLYYFDGDISTKELVPLRHEIKIENAKGLTYQYDARDLVYLGKNGTASSPESFGRNMKIEWDGTPYYHQIQKLKTSAKLILKYRITSNSEELNIRMFDPSECVGTQVANSNFGNCENYEGGSGCTSPIYYWSPVLEGYFQCFSQSDPWPACISPGNLCTLPPPDIPVTNCMTINSAGSYGMTQPFTNKAVSICIDINVDNVVFDCKNNSNWIDGTGSGTAFDISGTSSDYLENITIKNCNITQWSYGIKPQYVKNLKTINNNFDTDGYPFYNYKVNYLTLNNSRFRNTRSYTFLQGTSNATIANNDINETYGSYGIINYGMGTGVNQNNDNVFVNNTIKAPYCFYDYYSNNTIYKDNKVECGSYVIYSPTNSKNINFYNNKVITSATNPFSISSSSNIFFNTSLSATPNIMGGANSGGNYWGTASKTGYSDTCADPTEPLGICDAPYKIPNINYYDYLPISNVTITFTQTIVSPANGSYVGAYPSIIANVRANVGWKNTTMYYKNSSMDWMEITNCTNQSINGNVNINYRCIWNNTNLSSSVEGYDVLVSSLDLSNNNINTTNHYYVDLTLPQLAYVEGDFPEYPYSIRNPKIENSYSIPNTLLKLSLTNPDIVTLLRFDTDTTKGKDDTNLNNGTLLNGASITSNGKIGKGLNLDGVNDYMDIGNSSSLSFTSNFTLSAFVKTTTEGFVIVKDPPTTATYYVNTIDCKPWTNPGCSSADERGFNGISTMKCNYTDTLPSGAIATNIKVETYDKYLCSPAIPLRFYWQNGVNIGNYSTGTCSCNVGTAYPISYNLSTSSYNFGGENYFNVSNTGSSWSGIMGGSTVGWAVGKIARVTVTYDNSKDVPYSLSTLSGGQFRINNTIINSPVNVRDGNWHLLTATYSTGNMSLYIDGSIVNSTGTYIGSVPQNNLPVWIGRNFNPNDPTGYFNGQIDEVMLLNRTLNPSEIADLNNSLYARFTEKESFIFEQNISTGTNLLEIITTFYNYADTFVNMIVGYYDGSWTYSSPYDIISGVKTSLNIPTATTNVSLNITGNSTGFYTFDMFGNIQLTALTTSARRQTSIRNGQTLVLRVNASDANTGIANVSIDLTNLNGTGNVSMILQSGSLSAGEWGYFNATIPNVNGTNGYAIAPVYAFDTVGNIRGSDTFSVFFDNTPCNITSLSDLSTQIIRLGENVTVSASISDASPLSPNGYYILSNNISGTWNNDSQGYLSEDGNLQVQFNDMAIGAYAFILYTFDDAGNSNSSELSSFSVTDDLPVKVNNVYPNDGSEFLDGNLSLGFDYEEMSADNCTLYNNGGAIQTLTDVSTERITYYFDYYDYQGTNIWYVNCLDGENEYHSNSTNFTITQATLELSLLTPLTNISVIQNNTFQWIINVTCRQNDCGLLNGTLDYDHSNFVVDNNRDTSTSLCYQETANESTACGGQSTGRYYAETPLTTNYLGYDGDWNTQITFISTSSHYLYFINYSKPAYANLGIWQVKEGINQMDSENFTVPSNCFSQSELQFKLDYLYNVGTAIEHSYYCYNGTNWKIFDYVQTDAAFYEEAMWWNITQYPRASKNITLLLNQSQIINWTINATGLNQSNYIFNASIAREGYIFAENTTQNILVNITQPPYPMLGLTLVSPSTDISIDQNQTFNWAVNITCLSWNCGEINSTLIYDITNFTIDIINPYNLTLDVNQSAIVNYTINATGTNGSYNFYSIVNKTNNMWISNLTATRQVNITYPEPIIPAPTVTITNINPTVDGNVTQNQYFTYTAEVCCYTSDCGEINVSLDPECAGTLTNDCMGKYPCTDYYVPFGTSGCAYGTHCQCWTGPWCWAEFYINTECTPPAPAGPSSKSGLVNTTIGALPFYTNGTNPQNITLLKDECLNVTWYVNATGNATALNPHTFFAYANLTSNMSISNITSKVNLTIVEYQAPPNPITIIYPTATSYAINVTDLNYSLVGVTGDKCWYSNDSGITNYSIQSPTLNFTGLNAVYGSNTWNVYCNDTDGVNYGNSVTFTRLADPYNQIQFINNTPYSGTVQTSTTVSINVSVSTNNLDNITINWNGTIYIAGASGYTLLFSTQDATRFTNNSNYTDGVNITVMSFDERARIASSGNATRIFYGAYNLTWNNSRLNFTGITEETCGITTGDSWGGATSKCFGYSKNNNAGGGDFGVTNNVAFDHHSSSYWMLRSSCDPMYIYEYNTGGGWGYKTTGCDNAGQSKVRLEYYAETLADAILTQINATDYIITLTKTGLTTGTYDYNSTVCDTYGTCISTETRNITIVIPSVSIVNINPTVNRNVSQNQFFQYTVNVTCSNADCGEVNISLDPVGSTCVAETGTCDDTCDTVFIGDSGSFTATSNQLCGASYTGCVANLGSDYTETVNDAGCDNAFGAGTGDCARFGDSMMWYDYFCPSYQRKGSAVTSADCTGIGGCGPPQYTYDQLFDFTSTFFAGGGSGGTTGKTGLVNTTVGAIPFYTNGSNPINITLLKDESRLVTFWVNATGNATNGVNYTFFAFANITSNMAISSKSNNVNITIVEGQAPPADTCDCPSPAGHWTVTDNCIVSNCDIEDYNLYLDCPDYFVVQGEIRISKRIKSNSCKVIYDGGKFIYG